MTRIALHICLLIALVFATTAATCSKPVTDAGKYCAETAGKGSLNDILPRVNETIGCAIAAVEAIPDCMVAGLQTLGVEFGKDFLMCALEQIASAKFAKPGDTTAGIKQKRAKAYLESQKPQAGICCGCGNKWTMRTALPFEDLRLVFYARGDNGERLPLICDHREHTLPPFADGKVCVSNDFTVDDDNVRKTLRGSDAWMLPAPRAAYSALVYEI